MSKTSFIKSIVVAILCISVSLACLTLIAYLYFGLGFLINITLVFFFIFVITLLFLVVHIKIRYKNFNNYNYISNIIESLEYNLISIGAYDEIQGSIIYDLPHIKVENDKVLLNIKNIRIRKKIENYIDELSSALPSQYITTNHYFSDGNDYLIIEFADVTKDKRLIFNNVYELSDCISKYNSTEIMIDHGHIVDLKDFPHWLIVGLTGAGKSYLAQFILIQSLIKGFEIDILDIKRTYQIFKNLKNISYISEKEEIINAVDSVLEEMNNRQRDMDVLLSANPNALAVDLGYKPKLIIIEEYIALLSSLDSKDAKHLENAIKQISVLARSVNIYLIIVIQSSNTENINSSLRHNLTKILLGNAQSNIITSTFGTGIEFPKIVKKLEKGEGYIQLDRIEQIKIPSISFKRSDLEKVVRGEQS